jgi:hypothetical protein
VIVERLPDPERALNTRVILSPRYTPTHAKSPLPRNASLPARKRMSLAAATAVAAAGIGAVTATAGTSHWTNAVNNIAQGHPTASPVAGTAHLDAYAPGPEIGIAGTLEFSAARAQGNATAFGNISTAQDQAGDTTAAAVRQQPTRATAFGNISTAERSAGTATDSTAPARQAAAAHATAAHATAATATPAPAHATPAPAHATTAPAHATAASAHAAPAHTASARATPAHAAPAHRAAPAAPAQPYLIYDSVTPSSVPAGQPIATYANGAYAASPSSVTGHGNVLWIDTNGSDPGANALDVEPGDATPAGAAQWVWTKMRADHGATAIVYTMISDWSSVRANIGTLPSWMQGHVRYWIADPTGVPHVLPGANATQWYWGNNYDITTANPGFQS